MFAVLCSLLKPCGLVVPQFPPGINSFSSSLTLGLGSKSSAAAGRGRGAMLRVVREGLARRNSSPEAKGEEPEGS